MHPYKAEGIRGHNEKLRRMTRHYGAADPTMYHEGRVNFPKHDGPEESVGYGVDSAAATARSDRPARRMGPGNATATYARGGKVRSRAVGGALKPARKGKGRTNISINIMPSSPLSGGSGAPSGMPAALAALPSRPPVPMPPGGAGAVPPGAGATPGPLGQLALQQKAGALLPRRKGGRVHPDAAQDRNLIERMVKPSALKRAKGGLIKVGLQSGAQSGEGRLQRNRHMDHKLRPTVGVAG